MPIELLLILVVVGIAGIAGLTWLAGLAKPRELDEQDARSEWARHYPDDQIASVWITHDQHAALVITEQGPGLLWVMGADTVARHLLDFDIMDEPHGLSVLFHDYTAPKVHLHLDEDERLVWQNLIYPQGPIC
ncbi:hypothetical protein [Aestuariivita sp.]|jgi:hypothetical protein|uniref:hypothetical protein n=1 Tax=Aestuariivita sp. TaxID=1872407 RepID=UPI0021700316|nr:hypothetical protein [Aestuariivita sp.]MCE8006888.1 hypothetical protein [Aestuariivita sp.]